MIKKSHLISIISFLLITTSIYSQKIEFNLGLSAGFLSSQVEGDNLKGFNMSGFSLGLNGGFNINDNSEIVVATVFQKLGSARDGEPFQINSGNRLTEIEMRQIGIEMGYAISFGANQNGVNQFRQLIAFKLNAIGKIDGKFFPNTNAGPVLEKQDFGRYYLSSKLAFGMYITQKWSLDFNLEYGLQSIIDPREEFGIERLVPFHYGLGLSYYL